MAAHTTVSAAPRDRRFYTGMAALSAALVFVGFAQTYYLKSHFGTPSLAPLVHLHGIVFTSWFVLLLSQVLLVAARRTDLHRRLGVAGGVLAMVMIVVGPWTAIAAARQGVTPPGASALAFLAIPLGDILAFAALVGAGFYFRRQPETHKRLMLLATIAILPPAIARLPLAFVQTGGPIAFFGLTDLVLAGAVLHDVVTSRRLHPVYLWGGLLIVLSQPLRLALAATDAWLALAGWLTR